MDEQQYPGAPRWVKILIIVAAIILLLVILLAAVGGEHGPQRHMRSSVAAPTNSR